MRPVASIRPDRVDRARTPWTPRPPRRPAGPPAPPRATARPPPHLADRRGRWRRRGPARPRLAPARPSDRGGSSPGDARLSPRIDGPGRGPIGLVGLARDAMIRRGGMDDVGAARARHVAADAIVVAAPLQADRRRQSTAPIGVALQAATPEIGHLLLGRRQPMRIVAGDAAESALAGEEATALVHLLDLADEPVLGRVRRRLQHRPELIERQPGPIVVRTDGPAARRGDRRSSGIARRPRPAARAPARRG